MFARFKLRFDPLFAELPRMLAAKKDVKTIVDIGCGWGGMLIHAVQNYGVTALGNTVSPSQHEHARSKIKELGLEDFPIADGGANSNNMYTTDPDKMFDPVITAMTNQTLVKVSKI